jgi:LCP family protein required for cell wall assembly
MKTFLRYFVVSFLLLTLLLTPLGLMFHNVGDIQLLGGEENLMKDMPKFIDANSPFFEAFQDSQRVNVLLIGTNKNMTDTMILVSYDMKAQHVDLISIPRDTYYPLPGYNDPASKKINAIFYRDKVLGTASAVSDLLLGMPIHYYALVDYDGVANIVDAMGGIPMNIPFQMTYNDPYDTPPLHIDIAEGQQVLDGQHAVEFLRYRHGYRDGDIGRITAQQEFMKSAFKQMLSLKLPAITSTIIENVDSDISIGMAAKIGAKAVGLSGDAIQTYTLPGTPGLSESISFWFADTEKTAAMINEIYSIKPTAETSGAADTTDQTAN